MGRPIGRTWRRSRRASRPFSSTFPWSARSARSWRRRVDRWSPRASRSWSESSEERRRLVLRGRRVSWRSCTRWSFPESGMPGKRSSSRLLQISGYYLQPYIKVKKKRSRCFWKKFKDRGAADTQDVSELQFRYCLNEEVGCRRWKEVLGLFFVSCL